MRSFGLIGKNIDYSFSRRYFHEKFLNERIEAEYCNFDISNISEFPEIISKNKLSGLNITIPYKQKIISFLTSLSKEAEEIGAVNTIKFEDNGELTGHNTDHYGFTQALKPHLEAHHKKALILGTGGASKAIAYSFELLGIEYKFVSRNPGKEKLSYQELNEDILQQYPLLINCTPLGTFPSTDLCPELNFDLIGANHLIFDLIYNPSQTKLMRLASEKGARTINGLRMLELQAEKSWEIWNS